MMEIIKNIATVVGCVSGIIALMVVLIKPIRKKIVNYFTNQSNLEKQQTAFATMQEQLTKSLANDEEIKEKIDDTNVRIDNIEKRIDNLEITVNTNESARLKSELFSCGDKCRRGETLYPEEFQHIRDVYHKYNIDLGQNHDGTLEWNFIYNYYNNQTLNQHN